LRTDREKGLSTLALSRCHKRMQDQVGGVPEADTERRACEAETPHACERPEHRSQQRSLRYLRGNRTTSDQRDDKKGLTKTAT
jgi:hypothetical protein